MTGIRLRRFLLLFISAICCQALGQQEPVLQRLSEVFTACNCTVAGLPDELLNTELGSSGWLSDAEGFVVAFRRNTDDDDAAPLELIAGQVSDGSWQHFSFAVNAMPRDPRSMGGHLWNVDRMDGFILIGMRVAFDGIATSIFTPALERLGQTYGRVFGIQPGPIAIYQRPVPRFGPTHYIGLTALDLSTGQERNIYPLPPHAAIRLEAMAIAKAGYDELGMTWCSLNNHYCDAERFDNYFGWGSNERHVFDAESGAFALSVTFWPLLDRRIPVVLVCSDTTQLDSIRCEETALETWQDKLQTSDPQEVLTRAAAGKVGLDKTFP